jgi:hypothetical protein
MLLIRHIAALPSPLLPPLLLLLLLLLFFFFFFFFCFFFCFFYLSSPAAAWIVYIFQEDQCDVSQIGNGTRKGWDSVCIYMAGNSWAS